VKTIGEIFNKKAEYRRMLATPEWKAFSRRIRQERNNACESCKRGNIQTHVHHLFYEECKEAHEYKPEDVVLLCWVCHEQMHDFLQEFRRFAFGKLNPQTFHVLNAALTVGLGHNDRLKFVYAIAEMASSPGSVERFAQAWIDNPRRKIP
jgi:hypothetical protein